MVTTVIKSIMKIEYIDILDMETGVPMNIAVNIKGNIIEVFVNGKYKIYEGDWDGTFKLSWTNNPAWILMDMLVNKRYGLGNFIENLIPMVR